MGLGLFAEHGTHPLWMDIPSKPRVTSKEMGCTSKSASISPLQQRLGNPVEGFLFSRSLWKPTCRVFVYLRLGSTVSLLGKVATVTLAENMLLLLIAGIFSSTCSKTCTHEMCCSGQHQAALHNLERNFKFGHSASEEIQTYSTYFQHRLAMSFFLLGGSFEGGARIPMMNPRCHLGQARPGQRQRRCHRQSS